MYSIIPQEGVHQRSHGMLDRLCRVDSNSVRGRVHAKGDPRQMPECKLMVFRLEPQVALYVYLDGGLMPLRPCLSQSPNMILDHRKLPVRFCLHMKKSDQTHFMTRNETSPKPVQIEPIAPVPRAQRWFKKKHIGTSVFGKQKVQQTTADKK